MLSNGVKTSYTYDSRNRLVQAGNIHYEYDAEDVRTAVITPDYREDYTVDREATFSQVLSVSRTYVAGTKEETTYYYGSGLVYEKKTGTLSDDSQSNEDTTLQVYHFNHLGSTICLTDKTGTVTNRFNYGTYGELLTADKAVVVDITRFLYNGEYGVQTDANGLYYMRSRYYSPEIRRFINQDVVTGSINQSASLNRYSYVEGNPVSYTDPFGLSPYQFISRTIHIGLDVVGIFVPGANVVNALYYFAEGNIYGGVESLIFSLAGGALGKGFKYAAAGGKNFTISAETIAAITQGSRGLAAGLAANDVGQGIAGMIEDYGIDGKDISGRTILEVLGILANGAQMGAYGNAFANGFAGAAGVAGSEGKSESGKDTTRVGRWMSQDEYDKMVASRKVQMSLDGNTAYVANPTNISAFEKQAKPGSIYVEFDVDSTRIYLAGKEGWGQIPGPGSLIDRLNIKKGLPAFDDMPNASNIKIGGKK